MLPNTSHSPFLITSLEHSNSVRWIRWMHCMERTCRTSVHAATSLCSTPFSVIIWATMLESMEKTGLNLFFSSTPPFPFPAGAAAYTRKRGCWNGPNRWTPKLGQDRAGMGERERSGEGEKGAVGLLWDFCFFPLDSVSAFLRAPVCRGFGVRVSNPGKCARPWPDSSGRWPSFRLAQTERRNTEQTHLSSRRTESGSLRPVFASRLSNDAA